jgi:hypothetical protein
LRMIATSVVWLMKGRMSTCTSLRRSNL